jgi:hypothetical protein
VLFDGELFNNAGNLFGVAFDGFTGGSNETAEDDIIESFVR